MAGLNKMQLIGYLGRDPEVRTTQGGTTVATLNVAATRKWRDREGNLVEETEWVRVVVWGKMGESAGQYLRKGSMVYIEGRLQTRPWEDKDGVKRWNTDVVAEALQFLDRKGGGGDGRPHPADNGDDPASQSRTARDPNGGRRQRDEGPPDDLGPPLDYMPSGTDDDLGF